jgi:hypothetical protein
MYLLLIAGGTVKVQDTADVDIGVFMSSLN